jgi:hypothetical protein
MLYLCKQLNRGTGKPIDGTPIVTLPFDMDGEQNVSGADEAA